MKLSREKESLILLLTKSERWNKVTLHLSEMDRCRRSVRNDEELGCWSIEDGEKWTDKRDLQLDADWEED